MGSVLLVILFILGIIVAAPIALFAIIFIWDIMLSIVHSENFMDF